jgi:hypothetical protein
LRGTGENSQRNCSHDSRLATPRVGRVLTRTYPPSTIEASENFKETVTLHAAPEGTDDIAIIR